MDIRAHLFFDTARRTEFLQQAVEDTGFWQVIADSTSLQQKSASGDVHFSKGDCPKTDVFRNNGAIARRTIAKIWALPDGDDCNRRQRVALN